MVCVIFTGISRVQNYFHNNSKSLFTFLTVLTFALMSQKQWLVKLLVQEQRQWHQNELVVIVFTTATHLQFKKKKRQTSST